MGDKIDRDAAAQIIARVAAGRLRVKDAMLEIAALPAASAEDVRAGALKEAAARVRDAWEPGKGLRLSEVLALIGGAE